MKIIYDTCLYIDLLRDGSRLPLFTDRGHVWYLFPFVMMELVAGIRTPRQERAVDRLIEPYSRANRIIHLNSRAYYKAGEYGIFIRAKTARNPR